MNDTCKHLDHRSSDPQVESLSADRGLVVGIPEVTFAPDLPGGISEATFRVRARVLRSPEITCCAR
jgi:hypothetical protein